MVTVPLIVRAGLGFGAEIRGRAVLQQLDSTILLNAGWAGVVLESGALLLTADSEVHSKGGRA